MHCCVASFSIAARFSPGAFLYPGVEKQTFRKHCRQGSLQALTQGVPPCTGSVIRCACEDGETKAHAIAIIAAIPTFFMQFAPEPDNDEMIPEYIARAIVRKARDGGA
jgi:hypothetical protein